MADSYQVCLFICYVTRCFSVLFFPIFFLYSIVQFRRFFLLLHVSCFSEFASKYSSVKTDPIKHQRATVSNSVIAGVHDFPQLAPGLGWAHEVERRTPRTINATEPILVTWSSTTRPRTVHRRRGNLALFVLQMFLLSTPVSLRYLVAWVQPPGHHNAVYR